MKISDRWLAGQQVGLLAYLLATLQPSDPVFADCLRRLEAILQANSDEKWGIGSFAQKLPPSVLRQLAALIQRSDAIPNIPELAPAVKTAADQLRHSSRVWLPQIWSYHALLNPSSGLSLARMGARLFRGDAAWRRVVDDESATSALDRLLLVLRDPWAATDDKCSAIQDLTPYLGPTHAWPHIENTLIQQLFAWPLLVLAEGEPESVAIGISIPVAVDIQFSSDPAFLDKKNALFTNAAFIELRHDLLVRTTGVGDTLNVDQWLLRLEKAARVGKQLWRAKHGNHGDFRKVVKCAEVAFDFSIARDIIAPLAADFGELSLSDDSADCYLAQVVLCRLLGTGSLSASAITGSIGEQERNDDGTPALDYKFVAPASITAKARYVFTSESFERFVVPAAALEPTEETANSVAAASANPDAVILAASAQTDSIARSTEILFAHSVQGVADIVQSRGWRQTRYLRCPEVAWAIHNQRDGRPNVLAIGAPEVQRAMDALASNDSPVLKLTNVSPVAIGSALWHHNTSLRLNFSPSLSWAFYRPLNNEGGAGFWQLIWGITGASHQGFAALLKSGSRDAIVHSLADALNEFEPDVACPSHRAPDVLVILETDWLQLAAAESITPAARPFMVWPLLNELNKYLKPHADRRVTQLIGNTRIVLLRNDGMESTTTDATEQEVVQEKLRVLPSNAKPALGALMIFEWGFSQQTAALLLSEFGFRGLAVRKLLKSLQVLDLLRYGQGQYHIPRHVRAALQREESQKAKAARHYAAGRALAPFVVKDDFPSLALDSALTPESIHEAEVHFTRGYALASEARDQRIRGFCFSALLFLNRFTVTKTWSTVTSLMRAPDFTHEAYELAGELVALEARAHPRNLIHLANATLRWRDAFSKSSARTDIGVVELTDHAERSFRAALAACSTFPAEEYPNRLGALTALCSFLVREKPSKTDEIRELTSEALQLLGSGVNGSLIDASWYEWAGDAETRDSMAGELYAMGNAWHPDWATSWIKGFGASTFSAPEQTIPDIYTNMPIPRAIQILRKASGGMDRLRAGPIQPAHVSRRWEEGILSFEQLCGASVEAQSLANALRTSR